MKNLLKTFLLTLMLLLSSYQILGPANESYIEVTPTYTSSPTASDTPSPTPSETPTPSQTPSPTEIPTQTATFTHTPTPTQTATYTNTPTPTPTSTPTPTKTPAQTSTLAITPSLTSYGLSTDPTETLNLYRVVLHPEGHGSENWAKWQANPSNNYPAVQPYFAKPNGPKASIMWTPEMLQYLETLQIDFEAYKEILWIAGGIFNVQGNQEYLPDKRISNTRYYIPAYGPWTTLPVSQPVTSISNVVNSLELRFWNGVWWHRIETIAVGVIPNFTHLEKPWLFNNPFTSIAVEGNQIGNAIDNRGVIVPLYSKGEAWIPGTVLEKID